jgi:hypothetical protein
MRKRSHGMVWGSGARVLVAASGVGASLAMTVLTSGCSGEAEPNVERLSQAVQPAPNVDARRSLAITDQPILVNFGLQRVLQQIITTSGVSGLSPTTLFQQWWDTQNPKPGLGLGPHCDDVTDTFGYPLVNGYPYACRPAPAEGSQATCDPFADGSACAYMPVGLFMRFDLAPADGSHCGEYRIVFAKSSGRTEAQNRNLLIFEAALGNPHANQGLRGCERIVRAFADLSTESSVDQRRIALEHIYFDGFAEFDPVVSYQNYGDNSLTAGHVRTHSFVQPDASRVWSLREFKLARVCSPTCTLEFVPVSDKVNPFGPLFDGASTDPNAAAFQADFLTQVPRLAAADANGIAMNPSDVFDSGQSQASSTVTETNYLVQFGTSPNAFRSAIQSSLAALGSSLTPDDIVARAQVTSCAGCHRFSNNARIGNSLVWPASTGFTHVSERDAELETAAGVTRFHVSDALTNLLLPHRKQVVEDFLNNVPLPSKGPKDPIGGRWVH